MSEWGLQVVLVLLAMLSSFILIYPLKLKKGLSFVLVSFCLIFFFSAYLQWGGFSSWRQFIHQQQSQDLAKQMLKKIKSPDELIDKLKAQLDDTPQSAKGWFLLGRLYSRENKDDLALQAFAKAYQFKPQEEEFAINYAYSLWKNNNQQFNPQIKELFSQLLKKNPKQGDALAMLAMEAYENKAYKEAIGYWQQLLALVPAQSKEARAIRRAIAKAQPQN